MHTHDVSCSFGNPTCPGFLDDPTIHYSVEWIPNTDPYNCWNQHGLTKSRLLARLYLFEAKMKHGRKANRFRIREV